MLIAGDLQEEEEEEEKFVGEFVQQREEKKFVGVTSSTDANGSAESVSPSVTEVTGGHTQAESEPHEDRPDSEDEFEVVGASSPDEKKILKDKPHGQKPDADMPEAGRTFRPVSLASVRSLSVASGTRSSSHESESNDGAPQDLTEAQQIPTDASS